MGQFVRMNTCWEFLHALLLCSQRSPIWLAASLRAGPVLLMRLLVTTAVMAIVLLLLDLFWLSVLMADWYQQQLGSLLADQANLVAAAAFYLLYLSLVVQLAVRSSSPGEAARYGALAGFYAYGIYELTNWALIADWPAALVPVDWAWGVVLTAAVVAAGRLTWQTLDTPSAPKGLPGGRGAI